MARHSRSRFCFAFFHAALLVIAFAVNVSSLAHAQSSTPTSGGTAALSTPDPAMFLVAPALALTDSPSSIALGDLNGDGRLDLVVANVNTGKVSVFLGKGDGQFAASVDYLAGKQPSAILLTDLNGDGKLDVVVCNRGDGTLSVFLGNGDGTLGKPTVFPTVSDPVFVAVGDFNANGKADLAVAGRASQSIAIHTNDGNGGFAKFTPYMVGKSPNSLAVADFDGDNHSDLATANADGTVTVMLGRGDGTFRTMSSMSVGTSALSSIAIGDFNNDGKVDFAVTQSGAKLVTVFLGNGSGGFQKGPSSPVGSNPAFVTVADANGDGISDLIIANNSGNTFSVLLGNGDGSFQSSMDFVAGNGPSVIVTGDLNGDGHIDLAIANSLGKSVSTPLGNGDGTFKAARAYNADLQRKAVAVGDLDGDGKLDLVVTNFCGSDASCSKNGTASVFLRNADGSYRSAGNYPLGSGPLAVALADVNGDKKLDMIVANRGDNTISLLLGNGDGTFQSAITYPVSAAPLSLTVGDFNADGKVDLAITTDCGSSQCAQQGQVSVLLGNGDGSFQSAVSYPVGYSPVSIAAGDINGDGKPDLVVANACGQDATCKSKGSATVLLGDGKGAFQSQGDIALGMSPSSVALADLSNRKVLDLVTAHSGDNKVAVLQGNGDATFKSPVLYPVGTAPSSVVVADFNGDGKPDVAVANLKDSTVSLLTGNGDGTLQPAVVYPTGVGPESLSAVDAQGKGGADLVAANGNGGLSPMGSDVTVFRNLQQNLGITVTAFVLTSSNQMTTYGQSVTLQATLTGDGVHTFNGQVAFEASPDGVNYSTFDTSPSCSANQVSGLAPPPVSCTSTLLPGLTVDVQAVLNNDSNYTGSSNVLPQTVSQAAQTITVTTPAPATAVYNTTFSVAATASSGLAVAITTTGVCSGGGSGTATITMTSGTGTCTVQYNQAGDSNYSAAPQVTNSTTAQLAAQTITVTTPAPATAVYNTTFSVAATASSGLAVAITTTGVCSGGGSGTATITMTSGTGTCTVQYNQAGDSNYSAAPQVTNSTTAQLAAQTITVTTPAPATAVYNTTFSVAATASSGLAVAITTTGVCSGGGSGTATITMTSGTGTCTVQYNQAGDSNYSAAPQMTNSTTAQLAAQTITVTTPAPATAVYNTTFSVAATASSGLAVAITTTGVCSGGGSGTATITMTSGTGTCTVQYNQAGDSNYSAAPQVTNSTTAQLAAQTITVTTPAPATAVYNTTFSVAATASSGLAVAITTTGVCSGGGSGTATITMTSGTGTCTVQYNQAGNSNYSAAPQVTETTTAQKANATINVTPYSVTYDANPHTATGTATGVNGVNLASDLNLSGTTHTNAGSYPTDPWTFSDPTGNYASANGTVSDAINKATPTFSIGSLKTTPSTITYGTPSVTVSGTICAPGGVCPPRGETVTIIIQSQPPQVATINDNAGDFSVSYPTNTILGSTTAYSVTYSYNNPITDNNFTAAMATGQALTVKPAANATTTTVTTSLSPSIYPQNVTFTATVTGQYQAIPGGWVTFTATIGNSTTTICSLVPLAKGASNSTAQCRTSVLTAGNYTITATYVDDLDYLGGSSGTVPQVVQDYSIAVASNPANLVQVVQGYQLGLPNFTSYQQTVTLGVTPLPSSPPYGAPLTATCTVTPAVTNGPTCSVTNPITSTNYASVAVAIVAGTTSAPSPIGTYVLSITTQDGIGLPHTTNALTFYVVQQTSQVAVAPAPSPSGNVTVPVNFVGPAVTNVAYACAQVLNLSANQPQPQTLQTYNMSCSFGSQSQPLPAPVSVTIQTDVGSPPPPVGELRNPVGIFNALWLGMPAVVLLGSLRGKKFSRKSILQLLGLLIVMVALLQGIGCGGGGFTPPSSQNLTPTGFYQVQVVGTVNGQVVTSAVIPVTVGH